MKFTELSEKEFDDWLNDQVSKQIFIGKLREKQDV